MSSTSPFAAKEGWGRVGAPHEPPDGGVPPTEDDPIALLQQQNQLLAGILLELQERVQRGVVVSMNLVVAARSPIQTLEFEPPLFTLSLINDGPAIVEARIPRRPGASWVTLNVTELRAFPFAKGMIDGVALRLAVVGAAATAVRLIGTY